MEELEKFLKRCRKKKPVAKRKKKAPKKMKPATVPYGTVPRRYAKQLAALREQSSNGKINVCRQKAHKHVVRIWLSNAEYKKLKKRQTENNCRKIETTIKLILFGRVRY